MIYIITFSCIIWTNQYTLAGTADELNLFLVAFSLVISFGYFILGLIWCVDGKLLSNIIRTTRLEHGMVKTEIRILKEKEED